MNVLLGEIRPKRTAQLGMEIQILAGVVPATASTTVRIEPVKGIGEAVLIFVQLHPQCQSIVAQIGPTLRIHTLLPNQIEGRHEDTHEQRNNGDYYQ